MSNTSCLKKTISSGAQRQHPRGTSAFAITAGTGVHCVPRSHCSRITWASEASISSSSSPAPHIYYKYLRISQQQTQQNCLCCFCTDKMKNTRNHLPKLIFLNEFQLKHSCHILKYQRKVALRDFSHTKKKLWMKARGNWFMRANSCFKTVFHFSQVSMLEKKK